MLIVIVYATPLDIKLFMGSSRAPLKLLQNFPCRVHIIHRMLLLAKQLNYHDVVCFTDSRLWFKT